jgi:hypothetical protein
MALGGMASLHAGLIERARVSEEDKDWKSPLAPAVAPREKVADTRSEEMRRVSSTRNVELTPLRVAERPKLAVKSVPQPTTEPVQAPASDDQLPSLVGKTPQRRKSDRNPIRYAINRKGNLLRKRKFGERKALTLRVEGDVYDRLVLARQGMGRTSQDILETALVLYLNLLGINETDDVDE